MPGSTSFDFDGTTALVTGSTKGIGRTIAEAFANADANVVVNARSEESAFETVKELDEKTSGTVIGAPGNLDSVDAIERLHERATEKFGVVDVLVNNAAAWPREPSMLEASLNDWDFVPNVNARAPFLPDTTGRQRPRRR